MRKLSSKYARALCAAVAGGGAVAALVLSGAGFATAAPAAAKPVVLVTCSNAAQVEPSQYVLACGDGNDYLTGLHWVSWHGVAFGSGTEHLNDCNPSCAAGKFYTYPVLITLWRPEARPGHQGQWYFSRLTEIHTGSLSRPHAAKVPLTYTFRLLGSIG